MTNEELKQALEKYGEHLPGCECVWKEDPPRVCKCGLQDILNKIRQKALFE